MPQITTGLNVAQSSVVLRLENTIRLGLAAAVGLRPSGRNEALAVLVATLEVLGASLLPVDAGFHGNRWSPRYAGITSSRRSSERAGLTRMVHLFAGRCTCR